MTIILSLFFVLASVAQQEIKDKALYLDYNFDKINNPHYESIALSLNLKDSIAHYCKKVLNNLSLDDFDTDKHKYKYYRILLRWYDSNGLKDSTNILSKEIENLNIAPIHKSHLLRTIAIDYDHANDISASLDIFFKTLEFNIAHNLDLEVIAIRDHLEYILQNRFPENSEWVKKKKDFLIKIDELYLDTIKDSVEFDFFKETPFDVITSKMPDSSRFVPDFAQHLKFTRKKINTIRTLEQNPLKNKDKIYTEYALLKNYFNGQHKRNNVYYNVLLSYLIFLDAHKDYKKAVVIADELHDVLHKNISYDYFNYNLFYSIAATANKNTDNLKKAYNFAELSSTYEDRNSLSSQQTYEYLLSNLNLKIQNKIALNLAETKQKSTIILSVFVAFIILVIVIFYLKMKHTAKLKTINTDLQISKNELINTLSEKNILENKIITLENMISRELHDNFGNKITGILSSYEIMREVNEKEKLNSKLFNKFSSNFEKNMEGLVADIKDLIWLNNPESNSLFELLNRLQNGTNFKVTLHINNKINNDITLPKFWNRQIFLLFKEAIHNAYIHANAKEVFMSVGLNKGNKIIIECINKGAGFNVNKIKRKSGLLNMAKRAKSIDGMLEIDSAIATGTIVRFTSSVYTQTRLDSETESIIKKIDYPCIVQFASNTS